MLIIGWESTTCRFKVSMFMLATDKMLSTLRGTQVNLITLIIDVLLVIFIPISILLENYWTFLVTILTTLSVSVSVRTQVRREHWNIETFIILFFFMSLEIKPCWLSSRIRDVCSPKIYY